LLNWEACNTQPNSSQVKKALLYFMETKDPRASFHLWHYFHKLKDQSQARRFFDKCLELIKERGKTDVWVQWRAGYVLMMGPEKNVKEAFKYSILAANQGHALAQNNVGYCYHYGEGVTQSIENAVKFYKLSSTQGYGGGQHSIAYCYEMGEGVTKNMPEAVKFYTLAAENDYSSSQYNLGLLYEAGTYVTKDLRKARNLYESAASLGDDPARTRLTKITF